MGCYRLYITHHFSYLHCVLVFCMYLNDFRLCFCSQSQMQLLLGGQVVPLALSSHLPLACSCVVTQSRQPACVKTNVPSHVCHYKGDARSCRDWFVLMIQPKDGANGGKTMALGDCKREQLHCNKLPQIPLTSLLASDPEVLGPAD